jgi:hypothetical protein
MLTDQAYPPAFPASEAGSCLKVIRREDASLMDLANEFITLTRGKDLHKQSIVMIHSLSHMARSGTEGYVDCGGSAAGNIKTEGNDGPAPDSSPSASSVHGWLHLPAHPLARQRTSGIRETLLTQKLKCTSQWWRPSRRPRAEST